MALVKEFMSFHGHPDFYKLSEEECELHSAKNKDYSQGGDPLGNFKRVSDTLKSYGIEVSPAQVGFIYMMKQVDAAGRMLFQGYEGETEPIGHRLVDISVYAKLIQILLKEED